MLRKLPPHSLIHVSEDRVFLSMHALIQRIIIDTASIGVKNAEFMKTLELISQLFKYSQTGPVKIEKFEKLISHVSKLLKTAEDYGLQVDPIIKMNYSMGVYAIHRKHQPQLAIEHFNKIEGHIPRGSKEWIGMQRQRAKAYMNLHKHENAKLIYLVLHL